MHNKSPNNVEYKYLYKFDETKHKDKVIKINEGCDELNSESYDNIQSDKGIYNRHIRSIQIENLNWQYRKVTKGKPIFPTDTSLMKSLYLATENATKKWSQQQRNWEQIINELSFLHP